MDEGFGGANRCIEERDKALRQLEIAQRDIRTLRKVLAQVRPVLVTHKHKHLVDMALKRCPPSQGFHGS